MTSFATLVETSRRIAANAARLGKVEELAALLRALAPREINPVVHYLSGEIPQGKIGIGYAVLQSAAAASAGSPTLSIQDVDSAFTELAGMKGAGSAARRTQVLRDLLTRATPSEQAFLLKLLVGELRQGALGGVMIDAIAAAAGSPLPLVRSAAMYARNLGTVATAALLEGDAALARFQLELFSPISPMLAQTAADVDEALQVLGGDVDLEWKLDGARVQVHKSGREVRIFTRSLNEVTESMPEIVEEVRALPANIVVLDGEAIALDAAGRPHPFQVTMRRFGRKLNIETSRAELPIKAFFFDCLRLNERSVAALPLRDRIEALTAAVPPALQTRRLITGSATAAREFYAAALAAGHEGVMAKALDSPYEAGNRGSSWLKIKRVHTLDLVVLAAEWGHGRRTGKLSNLHLGAFDPASGDYVMLGKTFKGLTDATLAWQTDEFLKRETHRDRGTVYIRPEMVVEIAFSDLQASVRYPGGLALRLARVKSYRSDKHVQDADTMDAVRKLYAAQK
jgi:DNA ligase-1